MGKKKKNVIPFRKQVKVPVPGQAQDPIQALQHKKGAQFIIDKVSESIDSIAEVLPEIETTELDLSNPEECQVNLDLFRNKVSKSLTSAMDALKHVCDGVKLMEYEHSTITKDLHTGYIQYLGDLHRTVGQQIRGMANDVNGMQGRVSAKSHEVMRLEHTTKALFLHLCERGFFEQQKQLSEEATPEELAKRTARMETNRDAYIPVSKRIFEDIIGVAGNRGLMNELILSHGGVDVQMFNLTGGKTVANT